MKPPPTASGATITRSRLTLILVFALFVIPILIAWLYVNNIFDWHQRGLTNRGTLITPPIDITLLPGAAESESLIHMAPSNWIVMAVYDGACDRKCTAVLERLSVVRELLAQGSERVTILALTNQEKTEKDLQKTLVNKALVNGLKQKLHEHSLDLPAIVFLDWRHQIMIHFKTDAASGDIQHDLKRVLRATAIR